MTTLNQIKEYISSLPEHGNYAALNGEQKKRLEELLIERGVYIEGDSFERIRLLNELVNFFCEGVNSK
jgi:hypothetical protein